MISAISFTNSSYQKIYDVSTVFFDILDNRETLIKAFPSRKSQARSAFLLRFSAIPPEAAKETLI